VLRQPEIRERMVGLGMEVAPGPPSELGRVLRSEIQKWKDVAKAANIKAE
jgi:tripartite-type tricarboxylate transporter receptor subunit TctC